VAAKLWWMIQKDLVSELRARRVWPAMFLFGIVVAAVFSVQMDLLAEQKPRIIGSLLWLALFFAGMMAIDRSLAAEREEGCWEGLLLYPVSAATIYLAKLVVNFLALAAVQCVLIPLFAVLSGVSLFLHPWALLLVAVLGNVAVAAVGTLLAGLAAGTRHGGSLLVLLVLPLALPVVLAAAEATRLIAEDDLGAAWCRWTELLGASAIVFLSAGVVLFDFLAED